MYVHLDDSRIPRLLPRQRKQNLGTRHQRPLGHVGHADRQRDERDPLRRQRLEDRGVRPAVQQLLRADLDHDVSKLQLQSLVGGVHSELRLVRAGGECGSEQLAGPGKQHVLVADMDERYQHGGVVCQHGEPDAVPLESAHCLGEVVVL